MTDDPEGKTSDQKEDGALAEKPKSSESPEDEVVEAANRLEPEQQAEVVQRIMTSVMMQGPIQDPVRAKVNENHISSAIEAFRDNNEREYNITKQREDRKDTNRWFAIAVFAFVILVFGFVCWFFHEDADRLEKILAGLFGFGAGAVGGFGYGKSKSD